MKRVLLSIFALASVPMLVAQLALNGVVYGPTLNYCNTHGGSGVCQSGDTQFTNQSAATFADGSSAGTSLINRADGAGTVSISGQLPTMWNDGTAPGGLGRAIGLFRYSTLDLTNATNTAITIVNTLDDYGASGSPNSPSGWNGKATSLDFSRNGSNWKTSAQPLTWGGWTIINPIRQGVGAFFEGADATLVGSPDGGAHFCNPFTYFNHAGSPGCDSANWSPTGDAPKCGSLAFSSACLDTAYNDATHSSIMWKDLAPYNGTTNRMGRIYWFDYCQANGCTGMPHGADTYLYGYAATGLYGPVILFRVAKSGGIAFILDPAHYEFYAQANYSQTNVGDGTSWTSTLANAVNIFVACQSTGFGTTSIASGYTQVFGAWNLPVYLCANGGCGYAMATNIQNLNNTANQFQVVTFPAPWGPFTVKSQFTQSSTPPYYEFMQLIRYSAYVPDSTPYHSAMGMLYDNPLLTAEKTAFYRQVDVSLAPGEVGALPRGQSGLKFTNAPTDGAMVGRGIINYYDLFEHQGNVDWPTIGALDISHQPSTLATKQILGCYLDAGTSCGIPRSTKGISLSTKGWDIQDAAGFLPYGEVRDTQLNAGSGPNRFNTVSDTTFSSNGSYTIPMIAVTTDITANQGFFNAGPVTQQLYIYNFSGAAGGISISYQPSPGVFVGVGTPNSTITNNTWFQATFTHAATTHVCQVYINGVLIASGTPSTTPNVGAGSITIGRTSAGAGNSLRGQMAGIGWYNRVLTANEIMHNYKVLKANVAKRGITLP